MALRAKMIGAVTTLLIVSGCSSMPARAPAPMSMAEQVVRLPASKGRQLEVRVWAASNPSALVVFSAGGGGQPRKYERILRALAQKGFTIIAPVHDDALSRGDLSGSGGPASFAARIEDLAITRGYAKAAYADLPLVVMGHSFGSMMSALAIGAATPAGPQRDPDVRALVAFSSPGIISGLLTPETYRSLTAPLLMVTGDKDVVAGFVTDWRDHRALFEGGSRPGSALVVFHDADHNLIADAADADFKAVVALTEHFIRAHALNDTAARRRLSGFKHSGATIERR